MNEQLDFAKALALEAGLIMKRYFAAQEIGLEIKRDQTPVTIADKEINSLVISRVKTRFPGHGVLGEEESYNLDKDNLWIVDPLDGTDNFSSRIPLFAFSMALVEKGIPKLAVVFDPNMNRLLHATAGGGAYESGKKLVVTNKLSKKLNVDSWVVGGIENSVFKDKSVHGRIAEQYAQHGNIEETDIPVALALAMVGSGDFDAVVSSIKTPWDVAAGSLIAQEAGAKVTDLFGSDVKEWHKDANGILVAAPKIHEELLKTIQPALEEFK